MDMDYVPNAVARSSTRPLRSIYCTVSPLPCFAPMARVRVGAYARDGFDRHLALFCARCEGWFGLVEL